MLESRSRCNSSPWIKTKGKVGKTILIGRDTVFHNSTFQWHTQTASSQLAFFHQCVLLWNKKAHQNREIKNRRKTLFVKYPKTRLSKHLPINTQTHTLILYKTNYGSHLVVATFKLKRQNWGGREMETRPWWQAVVGLNGLEGHCFYARCKSSHMLWSVSVWH